jgi:hypothetical protein
MNANFSVSLVAAPVLILSIRDDSSPMRFTVTLDADVAAGIKSEMERSGESFKQVVNRLMRSGFNVPHPPAAVQARTRRFNRRRARKGPDQNEN